MFALTTAPVPATYDCRIRPVTVNNSSFEANVTANGQDGTTLPVTRLDCPSIRRECNDFGSPGDRSSEQHRGIPAQ